MNGPTPPDLQDHHPQHSSVPVSSHTACLELGTEEPDKAAGAWQETGRGPSKPHSSKGSTPSSLASDTATAPWLWLEVTMVGSPGATSPLKQGHPKPSINLYQ